MRNIRKESRSRIAPYLITGVLSLTAAAAILLSVPARPRADEAAIAAAPGEQERDPGRRAREAALKQTVATQKRLNRYFHSAVVPKMKQCWARVQGAGVISIEFTYTRKGRQWAWEKLAGRKSTLPRDQDAVALRCMEQAVRSTSFSVADDDKGDKYMIVWNWPVPWPADADRQAEAMFRAMAGGGSGGCDGQGAASACVNCVTDGGGRYSCETTCVGYSTCRIVNEVVPESKRGFKYISQRCEGSGGCASGGPFGLATDLYKDPID
jgi:hypothetical protein